MKTEQHAYLKDGIYVENSCYAVFLPQASWYMAGINVGPRNDSIPSFNPLRWTERSPHHLLELRF